MSLINMDLLRLGITGKKFGKYSRTFSWCSRCYKNPCACTREVLLDVINKKDKQLAAFHELSRKIREVV